MILKRFERQLEGPLNGGIEETSFHAARANGRAVAELDLGPEGRAACAHGKGGLPMLRGLGLLGLGDPLHGEIGGPEQQRHRARRQHRIDLLPEPPGFDLDRVEIDLFRVAQTLEVVAEAGAPLHDVTGLIEARLEDLEERHVEELDDLRVG